MKATTRIVAIGASAGGVAALQKLVAALPVDLPAAVVVVLHIDAYDGGLDRILDHVGELPAAYAIDGVEIAPGRIYVAPPDRHLVVEDGILRLTQGPKENFTRPAIDPTFRTLAGAYGPAAVGVILTGGLDDGTAGLAAIKAAGGLAIVQDPEDATVPSMPASAMAHVAVDHIATIDALGPLITRCVIEPMPRRPDLPAPLEAEIGLSLGHRGSYNAMDLLDRIGRPSSFTCPDCNGALWELQDEAPRRYRCHTGHAFTLRALEHAQADLASAALWNALRALNEKRAILRRLADASRDRADSDATRHLEQLIADVERIAADVRGTIDRVPSSVAADGPDLS